MAIRDCYGTMAASHLFFRFFFFFMHALFGVFATGACQEAWRYLCVKSMIGVDRRRSLFSCTLPIHSVLIL